MSAVEMVRWWRSGIGYTKWHSRYGTLTHCGYDLRRLGEFKREMRDPSADNTCARCRRVWEKRLKP